MRNNRRMVAPPGDRKPLVLSTYLDAQEHLPYADDSNAVTPMSEENGAMVVPIYYANLGKYAQIHVPFLAHFDSPNFRKKKSMIVTQYDKKGITH